MITVIILILALAVPGLSSLQAEARFTSATQMVNTVTTRAYYLALQDRTMTAVRFFPGAWDAPAEDATGTSSATDRQHMAIYTYVGETEREVDGDFVIAYAEYFRPAEGINSSALPKGIWAAPLEAVDVDDTLPDDTFIGMEFALTGPIGSFAYDAGLGWYDGNFLNADDFLIVCDPKAGVVGGVPQPYGLKAYSPADRQETDRDPGSAPEDPVYYQRYNFTGVVTYEREPFVGLGPDAAGVDRQDLLRRTGRPYIVHRYGGGLVAGEQRPE